MERAGDIEVFHVMFLGYNVMNHMLIFGSGMHPNCFEMIGLLITCFGDSEIEFLAERKMS